MKRSNMIIEIEDMELEINISRGDMGPSRLELQVTFATEWMFDVCNDDYKYPEIRNYDQLIGFMKWLKKNLYVDLFKHNVRFKNSWERLVKYLASYKEEANYKRRQEFKQTFLEVHPFYHRNESFKIERKRASISFTNVETDNINITFNPQGNRFKTSMNVEYKLPNGKHYQASYHRDFNIETFEYLEKQVEEWLGRLIHSTIPKGLQERSKTIIRAGLRDNREGITELLRRLNNNFNL